MNCPKCGSPVFYANIDDRETVLCMNDDCKWKEVIKENEKCPHVGYNNTTDRWCCMFTFTPCAFYDVWRVWRDCPKRGME